MRDLFKAKHETSLKSMMGVNTTIIHDLNWKSRQELKPGTMLIGHIRYSEEKDILRHSCFFYHILYKQCVCPSLIHTHNVF